MQNRMTIAASCLVLVLLITTLGYGKTIYVDADAPGPNNGSSWDDAFENLQDALILANQGDEIWVAQGVYRPDKGAGQTAGERMATFQLKNEVKIYGGYAGYGQPEPSSRDINAYPTILSGDLNGNDGPIDPSPITMMRSLLADPNRQDNAYVVVTGSDTDATAVLSGFTITGGLANAPRWPLLFSSQGAGLFVYSGSPTIQDCIFRDNLAVAGGAAVATRQASPSLVNCTFTNNRSQKNGGAMTNWYSSPVVSQCVFKGNRSDDNYEEGVVSHRAGFAGAVYNFKSNFTANGTTFEKNGGCLSGGAISNDYFSDANLVDCRFIANSAQDRGGAIESLRESTLILTHCLFLRNTASSQGGAVLCEDGQMTLDQCRFNGNTSTFSGGALYNTHSDIKVANCAFSGNEALDLGGAIGNEATYATLVNCTFWANKANAGAAIGSDSLNPPTTQSSVSIFNSILWDGALEELAGKDGTDPVVAYTDIYDPSGGWSFWPSLHNLSTDPGFVDANGPDGVVGTEDDNLRLAIGSPCIDAGANGRVFPETVVDLDGEKRFVDDLDTADTGTGTAPIVDMGAYEYVTVLVPNPM